MDDRTRGRRRARWTTGTLVALSLAGTVGVAVVGGPATNATAATTSTTTSTTTGTTTAPAVTSGSGSGSTHATTAGS